MGRVDWKALKLELTWFVRNHATDPTAGRTSTGTSTQSGDGTTKIFTVAVTNVQSITTVVVDSVTLTYGTDYSVVITPGTSAVITLAAAPSASTNNVVITYRYGTTWVYPDWPLVSLTLASYPRVAVHLINVVTTSSGIGTPGNFNDALYGVTIFADKVTTIEDLTKELRDAFSNHKKTFYNFQLIEPAGASAVIKEPDRAEKIVQQTLTFRIPYLYEANA